MGMLADGSEQGHTRKNADGRHEYDRGWLDGKHVATGARVPRATTSAGAMGMIEDASSKNTDGRYGHERGWFDAPVAALGCLRTGFGRCHKAGPTAKIPFQSRVV